METKNIRRLTRIMLGLFTAIDLGSKRKDIPQDNGFVEQTIDSETGEVMGTARRAPGSDITYITERDAYGRLSEYSEFTIKNPDGSWEIVRSAPQITKGNPNRECYDILEPLEYRPRKTV